MANTQYLTNDKYNDLKKELDQLKTERRKEVAEHLEYAKKLGDLSENAEYHQAREEQAEVEDRIKYIEELLKHAVIADASNSDCVSVGNTVSLIKEGDHKTSVYHIVGSEEADSSLGKISNLSPLGSAVLGKKKGDSFVVETKKGNVKYIVHEIK